MAERLVGYGGQGVSVRQLGGGRAGEMRIARFLRNPKVTMREMLSSALGLIDNCFLTRKGGEKAKRQERDFADKDSLTLLGKLVRPRAALKTRAAALNPVVAL